jgi:hypothetical protein
MYQFSLIPALLEPESPMIMQSKNLQKTWLQIVHWDFRTISQSYKNWEPTWELSVHLFLKLWQPAVGLDKSKEMHPGRSRRDRWGQKIHRILRSKGSRSNRYFGCRNVILRKECPFGCKFRISLRFRRDINLCCVNRFIYQFVRLVSREFNGWLTAEHRRLALVRPQITYIRTSTIRRHDIHLFSAPWNLSCKYWNLQDICQIVHRRLRVLACAIDPATSYLPVIIFSFRRGISARFAIDSPIV